MAKPANRVFGCGGQAGGRSRLCLQQRRFASGGAGEPAERTDFPCSPAQERFWLLDRLDPGNSAYNVAVRWRLEGRVATDLLERSWLKIIERHEVLRTVFLETDGTPIQRVNAARTVSSDEIDLSNLSPELQQPEGDRIGVIEARAPFDLASGPLIRATLLRFSPTVSIILITTHQIVSDGWSIGIMARENGRHLRRAAPRERDRTRTTVDPVRGLFGVQLEWLKVRGTEAEMAYWSRQLAGIKPFKVLPTMRARRADHQRRHRIAVVAARVDQPGANLERRTRATLFATAFAALCATLSRFTSETEIVVGTQVSGRDQVELESMIGQFVNSLILRNDLRGKSHFRRHHRRGARHHRAKRSNTGTYPIERLLGMVKSDAATRTSAGSP